MHAGRFAHEAAAYSPDDGILYLTEDNFAFPSGFYRYIPPSNPMEAGGISRTAARCRCSRSSGSTRRTSNRTRPSAQSYPIEWVDIDEPYPG